MLLKISVLKNFAIFRGKYLCWSLFLTNNTSVFLWILPNFYKTPTVAASGSNCSESYDEFLDSYFFNLPKCLFRSFPDSHFWKPYLRKKELSSFSKHGLVFSLANCAKNLVDSFRYKCMSCLLSPIWLNCVWGSWYLINWLEKTVQSSAMGFWTVTFSNWL